MTNNEKMAGACEVVVKMARRMGDVSDGRVEAGKVITLGKEATEVDPTDDDDLEEFSELSNDIRVEVESAVYGNDQDEFDREAVAELIGVDADVDDDVMKEACADYIREYHPDTVDSQENALSAEELHLLLSAKDSLSEGYAPSSQGIIFQNPRRKVLVKRSRVHVPAFISVKYNPV
jgi:hypothetical protein